MASRSISPIRHRIDARVRVPASKSVANRELFVSALADGRSEVDLGDMDPGDDVRTMRDALTALGYQADGQATGVVRVIGCTGRMDGDAAVDARDAGTVARFVPALAALRAGRTTIDGSERMRERPIGTLARALRALGAEVDGDRFPLSVRGPLRGGTVEVAAHESSQFASALLLVAAATADGIDLRIPGSAVSAPFIDLTIRVLEERGVDVERSVQNAFHIAPQKVKARRVTVPGDATAASYPAAAAAILGGRVTVENVDPHRRRGGQGDIRFFEILERMGCGVSRSFGGITVRRTGPLYAIRENVRDVSDVFPTLAVVAACADGRSEILGVGHTRRQESDRIAAVAAGLRALGGRATEYADGIAIDPAPLHGGSVDAAGDHRIAMAFSILGLLVPGVTIDGADAVSKTYPGFYDMVRELGH